jgi:hypothetical protein
LGPSRDPSRDLGADLVFVAPDIWNQERLGVDIGKRHDAHRRAILALDSRAEYAVGRGANDRGGPQHIDRSRQQGLYTRRVGGGCKEDCEVGPPRARQGGRGGLLDSCGAIGAG